MPTIAPAPPRTPERAPRHGLDGPSSGATEDGTPMDRSTHTGTTSDFDYYAATRAIAERRLPLIGTLRRLMRRFV